MRSDSSTLRHGTPSPSSSSATTGFTVAAGASAITPSAGRRGSTIATPRRIASAPDALTQRLSSTRPAPPRAGASTAVRRSSRESSTGVSTTRTLRHGRIGGSPASSSTRGIAVRGVARAGLEGALDQIAPLGGGLVEAIPEVTAGREAQGRFLFSATVELFEQYGFTRGRRVGKHAWIVSRAVEPG